LPDKGSFAVVHLAGGGKELALRADVDVTLVIIAKASRKSVPSPRNPAQQMPVRHSLLKAELVEELRLAPA
jgi:hypothetical protein